MNPIRQYLRQRTRRQFLADAVKPLGAAALASLIHPGLTRMATASTSAGTNPNGGRPGIPHFAPKAKRVINLFMCGGPSHIDTFDFKPALRKLHGQELPDSVRKGQRITGMTAKQKTFPVVAPMFKFKEYGRHGTYVSELLPHLSEVVDDMAIIKSMHTEAINHDPAITYINTGVQQPGKPSIGAWISYGLGSPNQNLPAYVVMISSGPGEKQGLFARLWGNGFLPSKHQGVHFRSGTSPVLYLKNPDGIDRSMRRRMLDRIVQINGDHFDDFGDPETQARIAQYEMAFRMQVSVPELIDLSDESEEAFALYGPESKKPGTFARNCMIARRLAERDVPFIQLFHRGWDQHHSLPRDLRGQCNSIDQPAAGLIKDLKQRGMLDETLVVWGGEFGRTVYSQGTLTTNNYGRDHHGRCFTTWLAGGGIIPGIEYGKTDDHCYNVIENPVHIRDLNATILHQLGIDHTRLTFKFQGLKQKLTGVEPAQVIRGILA